MVVFSVLFRTAGVGSLKLRESAEKGRKGRAAMGSLVMTVPFRSDCSFIQPWVHGPLLLRRH